MLRAARLITNNGFISQKRKPLKYSIGNPTWKCSNELFSVFYSFPLPSFLAVSCLPIKAMQLDLRPLHTHTQGKDNSVHSKAHWCSLLSHGHLRPTLPSLPLRFISDGKGRWWDLFPPVYEWITPPPALVCTAERAEVATFSCGFKYHFPSASN